MNIHGEITSASDCVKAINDIISAHDNAESTERTFLYGCREAFPFGLWFRGEPLRPETQLTPSIFRPKKNDRFHNEHALYNYTRNRFPELANAGSSPFHLICRMQHHFIPTRLLDWTESLLPALYFAASKRDDSGDAYLFFLNTRKLNHISGLHNNIFENLHDDSSYGTHFRCEFIFSESKDRWFNSVKAYQLPGKRPFDWTDPRMINLKDKNSTYGQTGVPIAALLQHCTPVAVYPRQSDPRMVHQRSVFTLHGGKLYNDDSAETDRIPCPLSLVDQNEQMNDSEKFLRVFLIKDTAKDSILQELRVLGVHEGTLFPDLDKQAMMIEEMF